MTDDFVLALYVLSVIAVGLVVTMASNSLAVGIFTALIAMGIPAIIEMFRGD